MIPAASAAAAGALLLASIRARSWRRRTPVLRVVRFETEGGEVVLGEDSGSDVAEVLAGDPLAPETLVRTGRRARIARRLAPVQPSAVLCVGLNYRPHAAESAMELPAHPVIFAKTLNAVAGANQMVLIPAVSPAQRVDYEAELAVVIGRRPCRNVAPEDALQFVAGYTAANDVSERSWQLDRELSGTQWIRGKSFDTFCPLGPAMVVAAALDPSDLAIRAAVNGETVQSSRTSEMIFSVAHLVSFLSQDATLQPGTVILTGTPEGVGFARDPPLFLKAGDVVTVFIEGIGELINPVGLA